MNVLTNFLSRKHDIIGMVSTHLVIGFDTEEIDAFNVLWVAREEIARKVLVHIGIDVLRIRLSGKLGILGRLVGFIQNHSVTDWGRGWLHHEGLCEVKSAW